MASTTAPIMHQHPRPGNIVGVVFADFEVVDGDALLNEGDGFDGGGGGVQGAEGVADVVG